jgi:aquaporin Z
MKKYLTEGIGTFFLALVLLMTVNNGTGNLAPLAVGAVLMTMTYAGWHISGAHYNPAVTLAMLMRGKVDRTDALYYVMAQIAGAVLAALIGSFLLNCAGENGITAHAHRNGICSLVAEFVGTFALAWVFLNVTTTRSNAGNSYYGLAIGFTVTGAVWALGFISGGAFNPAVAVGNALAGMFDWGDIWIYLLGALLGAAAAASVFQVVHENREV